VSSCWNILKLSVRIAEEAQTLLSIQLSNSTKENALLHCHGNHLVLLCRSTYKYWLHLYGNSGYVNMPECYIVYTLPILSLFCLLP
jgi:hypothetical protein